MTRFGVLILGVFEFKPQISKNATAYANTYCIGLEMRESVASEKSHLNGEC